MSVIFVHLSFQRQAQELWSAAFTLQGRSAVIDWTIAERTLEGLARQGSPKIARRAATILRKYRESMPIKAVDTTPCDMEPVA